MEITEDAFLNTLDAWAKDVRREALELFRAGVAHDHCLNVAMKVVEGKTIERARHLSQFSMGRLS